MNALMEPTDLVTAFGEHDTLSCLLAGLEYQAQQDSGIVRVLGHAVAQALIEGAEDWQEAAHADLEALASKFNALFSKHNTGQIYLSMEDGQLMCVLAYSGVLAACSSALRGALVAGILETLFGQQLGVSNLELECLGEVDSSLVYRLG